MPRSSAPLAAGVARLALAVLATPAAGQSPAAIGRLLGHVVYWFGWHAFYPDSDVYGAAR